MNRVRKPSCVRVFSMLSLSVVTIVGLLGCPAPNGMTPIVVCLPLSGNITTDTTLAAGCYDVTDDIVIENGATLTITPGTTMNFDADTKLQIESEGILDAAGTADNPILMTGMQQMRGFWNGVYFRDSTLADNRMDYVTVEYGGGRDFSAGAQGNVALQDFSSSTAVRATITNCTLRESSSYGFYFDAASQVDNFTNNTVTANTMGTGYIFASVTGIIDATGQYTGNDIDAILVEGNTMATPQTLQAIDVDFLIMDRFIVESALTVNPGVQVVFQQSASLEVRSDGSLIAIGTLADPIIFTGEQAIPGFWAGIYLRDSASFDNQLDYVTVEYGGGANFTAGAQGNLMLEDFGTPNEVRIDVTNSIIRSSSTYGIWLDKEAFVNDDIDTANTFSDNALGDVLREP